MPAFALSPVVPVPADDPQFDRGIQFQDNEVDVGPTDPTNVSFDGADVALTYDPIADTVHVAIGVSSSGAAPAGSPTFFSARKTSGQSIGSTVIFDSESGNGSIASASYDNATGVYTVPEDCNGRFEAAVPVELGTEASNITARARIMIDGVLYGEDAILVSDTNPKTLNPSTGWIALTAGQQVSVVMASAFDATNGVVLTPSGSGARFSGIFFPTAQGG